MPFLPPHFVNLEKRIIFSIQHPCSLTCQTPKKSSKKRALLPRSPASPPAQLRSYGKSIRASLPKFYRTRSNWLTEHSTHRNRGNFRGIFAVALYPTNIRTVHLLTHRRSSCETLSGDKSYPGNLHRRRHRHRRTLPQSTCHNHRNGRANPRARSKEFLVEMFVSYPKTWTR